MNQRINSNDTDLKFNSATRTTVLLGAGASAGAGLSLTSELAAKVIEAANGDYPYNSRGQKTDWVRALNAVYAGMVGYQGVRGDNPLFAVNIETLISAVRLLSVRETHEVAPFVAAWSPALSDFNSTETLHSHGKTLIESIQKAGRHPGFEADKVSKVVAEIARGAVRPDLKAPFQKAERFILKTLVDLLGNHGDVTYFEPLLELVRTQEGGADVITLNYDLTVESAAANGNVRVNRGIDSWVPGQDLEFPPVDQVLNLMKLHGSLDWRRERLTNTFYPKMSARGIEVVPPASSETRDRDETDLPWIVVGDRDKLGTEGPTLALNFAARAAFQRTTHLAVIGYSFGDPHINSIIRDWLAGDPVRTMNVLDVSWPRYSYQRPAVSSFKSELLEVYGRHVTHQQGRIVPRVQPLEGCAENMFDATLNSRPKGDPDLLVTACAMLEPSALRMDITWHGPDLTDAFIMATPGGAYQSSQPNRKIALYSSDQLPGVDEEHSFHTTGVKVEHWPSGSTQTAYAFPEKELPIDIRISGVTITSSRDEMTTVDEYSYET